MTGAALAAAGFVLVIAFSAVIQALTGFGFALCALSLLAWWTDAREASILLCPAGLALNAMLFIRLRAHFRWEGLVPLFLASLVGLPIGTFLLLNTELRTFELVLAALMAAAAVQGFRNGGSTRGTWQPLSAGVPCGLLGGVLSGAYGTGGPPIVTYLLNRPIDRFRYIASTQALLGLVSSLRVIEFVALGRIGTEHVPLIMISVAAVGMGTLIGLRLLHRFSDAIIRKAVLWFLIAGALSYIVKP